MSAADLLLLDVEALLAPISEAAPGGADVRYMPLFDEIKAARRAAEADPTRPAGWAKIADLAAEVLQGQSKDLQVAVWLLEALVRYEGFRGAYTGAALLRGLVERHWDHLYPPIDPDDDEPLAYRTGPMVWIDERLPALLKVVPITDPPAAYGLLHYEVTQKTGDERKSLIEEGWPDGATFDAALKGSTTALLEKRVAELEACQAEFAALEQTCDLVFVERRGDRALPILSFRRVRDLLETGHWLVEGALRPRIQASAPGTQNVSSSSEVQGVPAGVPLMARGAAEDGGPDAAWQEAAQMVGSGRLEGLQVLQRLVTTAGSGRDRFIRKLQLAELCLGAGVPSLALPVFQELGAIVDARRLEEWEPQAIVARTWVGLRACCERLTPVDPALEAIGSEAADKLTRLTTPPGGGS